MKKNWHCVIWEFQEYTMVRQLDSNCYLGQDKKEIIGHTFAPKLSCL